MTSIECLRFWNLMILNEVTQVFLAHENSLFFNFLKFNHLLSEMNLIDWFQSNFSKQGNGFCLFPFGIFIRMCTWNSQNFEKSSNLKIWPSCQRFLSWKLFRAEPCENHNDLIMIQDKQIFVLGVSSIQIIYFHSKQESNSFLK